MVTPLAAIELYREYLAGRSVEELVREFQLSAECIELRLWAANAALSTGSSAPELDGLPENAPVAHCGGRIP